MFRERALSRVARLSTLLLLAGACAADWTTFGGDPQRTGWAKDETELTKDNIKKLKLELSLKLHAFNMVNGEDRIPPAPFFPAFGKPWSLNLVDDILYTTTSQSCSGVKSGVYAMNLKDPAHPVAYFQVSTAGAGIWGRAGAAV